MTEPGSIEKVPLKVVPMYIEDDSVIEVDDTIEGETVEPERVPRPKTVLVGVLALAASVIAVIATIAAIIIATDGGFALSMSLAIAAIVLSVVGVVTGIIAVVLHRGRRIGVIAAVVGLLGNPYLLLVGLELLSGARS